MDSNAIQVAIRVRPWSEKELPFLTPIVEDRQFQGDGAFTHSPRKPASGASLREVVEVMDHRQLDFDKKPPLSLLQKRGQPGAKRYKDRRYIFDQVMGMETTQEDVFEKTTKPLLAGVLEGFNATVFAYGATGCGKTHTISGSPEDPGVIIRTMEWLFENIEENKDQHDTFIELSMSEVYNECIRDLLSPDYPGTMTGGLRLLENEKERVTVDRLTSHRPQSVSDVMELVQLGNARRSTSYTESNKVSSRSHAVLQINVGRNARGHEVDLEQNVVRQCVSSATLSIIDLAGSERAAATTNMGDRMKEGANINKSLLALSSCISALCQNPIRGVRPHIPYRNSKLTRMLKFSLGGNCRTVMIVCVSPSSKDIEDTHNTLAWADKAKNVSTKISRNTAGVQLGVAKYLELIQSKDIQIQMLEKQLADKQLKESTVMKHKAEHAKMEAQRAVSQMRAEVEAALPFMVEGATNGVLLDGAEMRIAALNQRISEIGQEEATEDLKTEKTHLEALVRREQQLFKWNSSLQATIQKHGTSSANVERLLKNTEGRMFDGKLGLAELEHVRLNVIIQREQVAKSVSAAKEEGYRMTVSHQAEAITKAAVLLSRMSTSLQTESAVLERIVSEGSSDELQSLLTRLRSLGTTTTSSLGSILSISADSPPLP
ncbi:hypothetical protein P7C73_g6222, partial [Tremellales sp. Uapishka_1]